MSAPSVTYSFTNGNTSDATQVNTNFTDLINGSSDGTRDYTVGTLIVNGATTLKGTVNLGDSTSDDISVVGSIAASIPFKTNATYNIGTSILAPLSIYLGNGTKTTRILAGTIGTSYTLTLPNDVPSVTGMTAVFDTNATMSFRYPDKFTATKTTNYTATGDETVILCDPTAGGASFTITLPAASTMTGKELTIVKIDAGITYTVTIDGNASETIIPSVQSSQLTYILFTQYESVTIKCNGTSWYVVHHSTATDWSTPVATTITGSTSNPSKGNSGAPAIDFVMWRRFGRHAHIQVRYKQTNSTGSAAGSGDYQLTLPGSLTMDTTNLTLDTTVYGAGNLATGSLMGSGLYSNSTTTVYCGIVIKDSTTVKMSGSSATWSSASVAFTNATYLFYMDFVVPISGWNQ